MDAPWPCVVWEGVEAVLARWARAGVEMAVATSATTASARRVVDRLGWSGFFGHVAGTAPGVHGKDEVLVEALLGLGRVLPDGGRDAAMVGDSPSDVWAARVSGLTAVAVTWSGTPAELLADADLLWPRPDAPWHPPS